MVRCVDTEGARFRRDRGRVARWLLLRRPEARGLGAFWEGAGDRRHVSSICLRIGHFSSIFLPFFFHLLFPQLVFQGIDHWKYGGGSKLNRRGYAGFDPCFHLAGFHFGTGFWSHCRMCFSSGLKQMPEFRCLGKISWVRTNSMMQVLYLRIEYGTSCFFQNR